MLCTEDLVVIFTHCVTCRGEAAYGFTYAGRGKTVRGRDTEPDAFSRICWFETFGGVVRRNGTFGQQSKYRAFDDQRFTRRAADCNEHGSARTRLQPQCHIHCGDSAPVRAEVDTLAWRGCLW